MQTIIHQIKTWVGWLTQGGGGASALTASSAKIIPRSQHSISRQSISRYAIKVLYRLHNAGYAAFLVGGSVRDLLLQQRPKDFDVTTDARPEQIRKLMRNSRLIGRRFRLAHVFFGSHIIEVATFRAGSDVSDKADRRIAKSGLILRDNVYGTIEQDAMRRDFTINALYYNIADFSVVDFTNGIEDLKSKTIRLIGDPLSRYQEDPVRMLRAIRLAGKLGFTLAPETEAPIRALGHLLSGVSSSRLFQEMTKIITSGKTTIIMPHLTAMGLLQLLIPQLVECQHPLLDRWLPVIWGHIDVSVHESDLVTESFFLAAALWYPMQQRITQFKQEGFSRYHAIEKAISHTLQEQLKTLALPHLCTAMIRDIWILQFRLKHWHASQKASKLLYHRRFKVAKDFLLQRLQSGEDVQSLLEWWNLFEKADKTQQKEMMQGKLEI